MFALALLLATVHAPTVVGPRTTADSTPTYRFVARGVPRPRFDCGLDRQRLRRCPARITPHLSPGRHVLRVRTVDRDGRRSRTVSVRIVVLRPSAGAVEIHVGGHPISLAEANGSIWVANYARGVVQRIDPATNRIVATVRVPGQPWGLTVADGAVWAGNNGGHDVVRIDPATNRVTATVRAGVNPVGITSDDGSVWAVDHADGNVTRIDAATATVTGRAEVTGVHEDAAAGLGSLWVADEEGLLTRLDAATLQETATIQAGLDADFVLVADGSVWATAYRDRVISRIDPASDTVTATVPVRTGMQGVLVDGESLWTANYDSDSIYRLDASGRVLFRHKVGVGPRDLLLADGSVWVANSRGSTVTRVVPG
jgi:virginiamycin B lyase